MKQVVLKHTLNSAPKAEDFELIKTSDPLCPDGGIVMKPVFISLDPYVGSRLRGRHMGEPAPEPRQGVIPGAGVGEVVESRSDLVRPGDFVHSMETGWRELADIESGQFEKIDPNSAPLTAFAGVLGMPGLTAWAGVTQLAKVHDGDVFLVNAAAGPVGGTAGQIARARGAKTVIGIAGGPEKCAIVTDEYGFDACFDYKLPNWQDRLMEFIPGGITVHYENVGSDMLAFAIANMQLYGRAVICGLAAHYHADAPPASIAIGPVVGKRAAVMGLVVYDYYDRWQTFRSEIAPLVKSGEIKIREHRVCGLENAPALLEKLVTGKNVGKAVVEMS